ncbi:MAG: alpha-ketoglutarate-dependent dioxygenase AlkB family protein [Nitrososphaeraceae archaeon]|jgi:alkylated DNA repair dioxygenase AlkB
MNLIDNNKIVQILNRDGRVDYYGKITTNVEANLYFEILLQNIVWKNDEAIILGKHIITKRKTAWYGDSDYLYTYSNTTRRALPWTSELRDLKQLVEKLTETKFNSCLLNLYHDGNEGLAWHSDDEKVLRRNGTIASLSFGAERKFSLKHKKTKQTISIILEHGSLLVMKDETQIYWLHSLPKTKKIVMPRINLTFREIIYSDGAVP